MSKMIMLGAAVGALMVVSACANTSTTSSTADPPAATSVDATTVTTFGSSQSGSSQPTTADASPGGSAVSTPASSEEIDPGLQPYIDIAVADLAERLAIDAAEVEVTSAMLESWSDSSLGCPQADQQYAQVVTDGSLIVLTTGSETYRYHAGGSRTPFLCEQSSKVTPITGLTTP